MLLYTCTVVKLNLVTEDNLVIASYFPVGCSQLTKNVKVELTETAGRCTVYASTEIII